MTIAELRAQRERLIRQAGECVGPNSTFATPEKRVEFDRLMGEIDALLVKIEDTERTDQLDAAQRTVLPESQRPAEDPPSERETPERAAQARQYRTAMLSYCRDGLNGMTQELRQALQRGFRTFDSVEQRVMSAIGGAAGGFTVMPDMRFAALILTAEKFFGGIEAAGADEITTDTGADLPFPTVDDTSNTGSIIAESGSHATGTDVTFGLKILKTYLYSTKIVLVPWQLLQDTAIDIEQYLATLFGMRLGRIKNTHYTTGTGVSQPQGLMTAITVGRQAAVGNSTSWPFDDVYRTIHSIDPAYRQPGRCRWMMHDNTILQLRLAKD